MKTCACCNNDCHADLVSAHNEKDIYLRNNRHLEAEIARLRGELDAAETEITGLSHIAGIYERENIRLRAVLQRIADPLSVEAFHALANDQEEPRRK